MEIRILVDCCPVRDLSLNEPTCVHLSKVYDMILVDFIFYESTVWGKYSISRCIAVDLCETKVHEIK